MKIELSGKLALVTGSTGGIGKAIVKGLAATGAQVVINGRRQQSVDNAMRWTFVNNAGVFEPKSFFEIPDEDWLRLFQINVLAGVRLSRAYMRAMLSRNWGRIVFISSESALNIPKEMIHYGFTKAGELAVARGLAQLTAGTAVTVNSVLPGPTRSDGVEAFLAKMAERSGKSVNEMAADFVKEYRPTSLLQRFARVEEVANMVVYAASKEASATNGAALRVDGGIVQTIV